MQKQQDKKLSIDEKKAKNQVLKSSVNVEQAIRDKVHLLRLKLNNYKFLLLILQQI